MKPIILSVLTVACSFLLLPGAGGQDKKADKKDTPRVVVVAPLGVPAGAKSKVTIYGVKLDTATELRFADDKVVCKVLQKTKLTVSNKQDPNKVGDSLIVVELELPAETMAGTLSFVVVTPAGESPAHTLLVDGEPAAIAEKEPNNGFRQAQLIQVPQVVNGAVNPPQDVDVFRLEGKAGQRVLFEVLAARHGSPLDSTLTLYSADGQIVGSNDDFDGSTDSRLEIALPRDGVYFVSIGDAHDQGGPAYVYRLRVESMK